MANHEVVTYRCIVVSVPTSVPKWTGGQASGMTIYTRRGDEGQTDLRDMSRVSKSSARIEAYGTLDEVNALIGAVRPTGYDDVDGYLEAIQNHLHIAQADLANPEPSEDDPVVSDDHVKQLEAWIDEVDEELDPLQRFILPGGSDGGAKLHHARAVTRRAERRVVRLLEEESIEGAVERYVNRLSDALFVFARVVNKRDGVPEENPTY